MPIPMCTEIAADQDQARVESEVVGVHNGIIENYAELKEKLLKHGYTFLPMMRFAILNRFM